CRAHNISAWTRRSPARRDWTSGTFCSRPRISATWARSLTACIWRKPFALNSPIAELESIAESAPVSNEVHLIENAFDDMENPQMKTVDWLDSSLDDLRKFPKRARRKAGYELEQVQLGLEPSDWKPMLSIAAGVNELRIHAGTEHRVIY